MPGGAAGVAVALFVVAATALLMRLAARRRRRLATKLVLHFDINETIMVGDPAGGDSFEDCLNKMICKNAFVRPARGGRAAALAATSLDELRWLDGSPLDAATAPRDAPPPLHFAFEWPDGCVPFYKVTTRFKRSTKPAHHHHHLVVRVVSCRFHVE